MRCPECDAANPPEAVRCRKCGARLGRRPRRRDPDEEEDEGPGEEEDEGPGAVEAIVPYKNPAALSSYYLAFIGLIVGLLPVAVMVVIFFSRAANLTEKDLDRIKLWLWIGTGVGFFLGVVAFALGIFGFLYGRSRRSARGQAHATTGTILGGVDVIVLPIVLFLVLRFVIAGLFKH